MIKKLNSFLHQSFLFITTVVLLGCVSLGNYWSLVTVPQESGLKLTKITDKEDLLDTEQSFAISKDGTKVVFTSWKSGNGDIYIKSIKGGKGITQRTSRTEQEVQPSFSPDGSQIVFCSPRDDGWHIYMIQTEGGSATKQITTSSPRYAYYPSFSTDGKKIVFYSIEYLFNTNTQKWEPKDTTIWTYEVDTGMLTQWTSGVLPKFTPDGEKIVFKRRSSGDKYYGLWMLDLKTGAETHIIGGENFGIWQFDISPDGKKIVFSSDKDTKDSSKEKRNANLWVVNSDGTGLTQLTFHLSDDIWPVWSPDMTGIYFLSSRGEEQEGVMNIWRLEYDNK
jgi:TolB protein